MDQTVQEYINAGMTEQQAYSMAGLPMPEKKTRKEPEDIKASLRDMANEVLLDLLENMQRAPASFKPNEIIAAAREALDRSDGKPAQVHALTGNATINIVGAVPAPYSQPAIDAEPLDD